LNSFASQRLKAVNGISTAKNNVATGN